MKVIQVIVVLFLALNAEPVPLPAEAPRSTNTVILNETGVRNLRIKTELVEERAFEESIFALGRIEVYPGRRAMISSRIAGRAQEVRILHDHFVKKGEVAVVVESRQPGSPPPTVEIEAPISGLVSAVHIVVGEPVSPDRALAEVLDLKEIYALARVPEHLAGRLARGQRARLTLPAVPGKIFETELEHLGAVADSDTGTVEAAFRVGNPDYTLRPGMRAEFSIVVDEREGVFSIPRAALQGDVANRFVYVVDFDLPNAYIKIPVAVGRINDRSVEVLSGLFPGDEVVTNGAYSLGFAGGGSVSLKEALDAAHGHEHAEDGSELKESGRDTSVSQAGGEPGDALFWKLVSAVFFVLLVIVAARKKVSGHAE